MMYVPRRNVIQIQRIPENEAQQVLMLEFLRRHVALLTRVGYNT